MDARTLTMIAQWAANANTNIPAPPVPGQAYRREDVSASDIMQGQKYSVIADSSEWNQLHWLMSGMIKEFEQYGIARYSQLTDYPIGALTLGLDLIVYQSIQASGPNNGGAQSTENSEYWQKFTSNERAYELCEFYYFRKPGLKPGFQPAQGGLLANAATLYPEAWTYLQTTEGQLLCKTEAAWQAMTTAPYYTLADGTQISFDGIGGAPFYAPNLATGALRLPDLRGMYIEAAGFDSLDVGGTHIDRVRDHMHRRLTFAIGASGGTLRGWGSQGSNNGTYPDYTEGVYNAPIGNSTAPRAWGALPCVYLGTPAS